MLLIILQQNVDVHNGGRGSGQSGTKVDMGEGGQKLQENCGRLLWMALWGIEPLWC